MKLEIVVDSRSNENWIALLKDGRLIELHEDKGGTDFSVGDIYLGKVRRVVPIQYYADNTNDKEVL